MSADPFDDLARRTAELAEATAMLAAARKEAAFRLTLVERAERIYRNRRCRENVFADDIFGEPAFDILLDLYISMRRNRQVSISSCCIAAAVPSTTALRHISLLEKKGYIAREPDPFDRRRHYLRLSDRAVERMEAFLSARA